MTTFPDAMPDIRGWLRTHPDLAPLHAGRVFFRIPDSQPATPFMRIYRSSGAVQPGETPIQDLRISLEIWGTQNSDYQSVRQLAVAVEGACHKIMGPTPIGSGATTVTNAQVQAAIDTPEPDSGWPRISIETVFTVRNT